jgi:uncharacterized membrane protein HdeD (DUF308 family)
MNEIVCPHCRGSVQHGATVCRGCQAEIEYGVPPVAYLVLAVACAFIGYKLSTILPNALSFLSWVVGVSAFAGGSFFFVKKFGDRVNFKRIYRTR